MGTLVLMYHRFNENKYPSTNIRMNIFKKQMEIIEALNFNFYDPKKFVNDFKIPKLEKKILITIDDAFTSFYENAWPFLKKNQIPFILFVSTEAVGKNGYMSWEQIKEVEKEKFAYIGNHSHAHDYMVDFDDVVLVKDLDTAEKIFIKELGYNPIYFSYPFGEYSKNIVREVNKRFKISFGQHSGVVDVNKDMFQLPRFPINEKYGNLDRFKFLIKLQPLQYKNLFPKDKLLDSKNNPPKLIIEFFKDQKNIQNINCFSDEGNGWKKSNINFINQNLNIEFRDKFLFRRGRVNCSLNDNGVWRWFGVQFSVKEVR